MAYGDLHIHTNVSDGVCSPEEVAQKVLESGLGFFSVADHNSVGALRAVDRALPADGPRFIYGAELSAQPAEGDEMHLLGYGFDVDSAGLQGICDEINRRKEEQLREMAHRLRQQGVPVELAPIPLADDGVYLGRPMLAEILVRNGVVSTLGQAFARYLGREGAAFVPMRQFSPRRCIEGVHDAGGLVVLAHPTIAMVDRWIEPLGAMGLDGVEAYRPALTGNEQLYVEKAAEHFGLFCTGGSDWHGRPNEAALGVFSVSDRHLGGFFAALALTGDG